MKKLNQEDLKRKKAIEDFLEERTSINSEKSLEELKQQQLNLKKEIEEQRKEVSRWNAYSYATFAHATSRHR